MLAAAYNLGALPATPQLYGDPVVWADVHGGGDPGSFYCDAVTAGGDIYRARFELPDPAYNEGFYVGSIYGGTVPGTNESLGDVKSMFR